MAYLSCVGDDRLGLALRGDFTTMRATFRLVRLPLFLGDGQAVLEGRVVFLIRDLHESLDHAQVRRSQRTTPRHDIGE